ncbi:MAG: type II toxin-antitoxin system VapC family toxin [Chloroflexi bacterium]|nr:type II toxin-antitoxin system VapC family toxin [Chloroflexota bacterium]
MKFLDANIFIYAYYKPKKQLTEKEAAMKEQAKKIVSDISQGKEQVTTTVVHVSEIVNILKNGMPKDLLTHTIFGLFMLDNVTILDVTKNAYFAAVAIGEDLKLEPNDALAVDSMRQNDIAEIYSFDEHFFS